MGKKIQKAGSALGVTEHSSIKEVLKALREQIKKKQLIPGPVDKLTALLENRMRAAHDDVEGYYAGLQFLMTEHPDVSKASPRKLMKQIKSVLDSHFGYQLTMISPIKLKGFLEKMCEEVISQDPKLRQQNEALQEEVHHYLDVLRCVKEIEAAVASTLREEIDNYVMSLNPEDAHFHLNDQMHLSDELKKLFDEKMEAVFLDMTPEALVIVDHNEFDHLTSPELCETSETDDTVPMLPKTLYLDQNDKDSSDKISYKMLCNGKVDGGTLALSQIKAMVGEDMEMEPKAFHQLFLDKAKDTTEFLWKMEYKKLAVEAYIKTSHKQIGSHYEALVAQVEAVRREVHGEPGPPPKSKAAKKTGVHGFNQPVAAAPAPAAPSGDHLVTAAHVETGLDVLKSALGAIVPHAKTWISVVNLPVAVLGIVASYLSKKIQKSLLFRRFKYRFSTKRKNLRSAINEFKIDTHTGLGHQKPLAIAKQMKEQRSEKRKAKGDGFKQKFKLKKESAKSNANSK